MRARPSVDRARVRIEKALLALGDECVWCGSDDRLEFDHVDPRTKIFEISQGLWVSDREFWDEVAKCQLLCKTCHATKSVRERIRVRPIFTHGTRSMYQKHGCHCDDCKAWNATRVRRQKAAKRAQSGSGKVTSLGS